MTPSLVSGRPLRAAALIRARAVAPLMLGLACGAALGGESVQDPVVVVTASRGPQLLTDALPHTTLLSRDDIERSQAVDLPALLAAEAGVQFASNGGRGTVTSLFLRGAPTRQVLVLVDGMVLSRQDATGLVGIEHLMLDQVDHIEIVRGNVSALYGSGAVGGVIQVFTRQAGAAPQASVRLEAGSRGFVHGAAQGSATLGATALSLGVSRESDHGFSALDPQLIPAANPDRDGYRNTSAAFNLSHKLADGHRLGFGWVHSDGQLDYDSAFATSADVQNSRTRKDLVHLSSDDQFSAAWRSVVSLSSQRDDARYVETGDYGYTGQYQTQVAALNWVNTLALSSATTLTAGLDHQRQRIDADDGFGGVYAHARNVTALFGGLQAKLGAHDLALNLRQDHTGGIGAKATGSLGWGWQVAPAWKLIASLANAFSAPPLGYLYAPYYGNPSLQPELARSAELGLQWAVAGQRLRATLFQTRVEQELEYDTTLQAFSNLARTRNRGLELSYAGRVGSSDLRAGLTAQDPVDASTGAQRLRRSKTLASAALSQDLGAGWRVGLAARYVGDRPDSASATLPAYSVADLTVQWDQTRSLQWFAHIENLGDRRYQTATGYNQPPRGVFGGLRWRL